VPTTAFPENVYRQTAPLREADVSADAAIRGSSPWCKHSQEERDLWNIAKVRDFNIGVQAAMQSSSYETALSAETVNGSPKLTDELSLTVYRLQERRKSPWRVAEF